MTTEQNEPFDLLCEALQVYLDWQSDPERVPEAEFLARNEPLRRLLEPMLREGEGDGSDPGERRLGDFRLVREIGRGGCGVVFEAEQVSIGRRVALKVLAASPALSALGIARFKREATMAGRLRHDGIVKVFAVGEDEGHHFFAMDLVPGAPLDRVLESLADRDPQSVDGGEVWRAVGTLAIRPAGAVGESEAVPSPPPAAGSATEVWVAIAARIADALHHAHEAGIVHRDVKPSNILVRADGQPVLTDFGLAREQGLPTVSVDGAFVGTPGYVSPEQIDGRRAGVDRRTDVFALGVSLYEMLTLQRPFESGSSQEEMRRILKQEPPPPARLNPRLPSDLCAIVGKCLEKEPERRYATAHELAEDLRAFLSYQPVRARPVRRLGRLLRWMRREPLRAWLAVMLAVAALLIGGLGGFVALKQRFIALGEQAVRQDWIESRLAQGFREIMSRSPTASTQRQFAEILTREPGQLEALCGMVLVEAARGGGNRAADIVESFAARHEDAPVLRILRTYLAARERRLFYRGDWLTELGEPDDALDAFLTGLLSYEAAIYSERAELGERAFHLLERACLLGERQRRFYLCAWAEASRFSPDPRAAREAAFVLDELWPDEPDVLPAIARALGVWDTDAAIARYRRAIARGENSGHSHQELGVLLMREGQLDEAERMFRAALARQEDSGTFHSGLATLLKRRGALEEGLAHARRAVELEPNRPDVHFNVGILLQDLGRWQEAADCFAESIALDPFAADSHYQLARCVIESGDLQGAVPSLRRAVELAPRDAAALTDLGVILARTGAHEEAAKWLRRALEIEPGDGVARRNLAVCLFESDDPDGAIAELRRCVEDHGDDRDALLMLGQMLIQAGSVIEGGRFLAEGMRLPETRSAASDQDGGK